LRRAHVQLATGDVLEAFARAVARTPRRLRRLTVVSPWVSYDDSSPLLRLLRRAEHDGAAVVLVTRPATCESHAEAIQAVASSSRGRVFINERLHAKLYVCQEHGSPGFAVIGSANMTSASSGLEEFAMIVRPLGPSGLIATLAGTSVSQLARRSIHNRRRRARRHCRQRRVG
jgi:hypothetical protein